MPVARSQLARDLVKLGLGPGGVVMVHCRMSALGWVVGGAETVVHLLLSIELPRFGGLRPAMDQRRLQSLRNEPLAHPSDRRAADFQGIGDLGVGPGFVGSTFALVGFEKDARIRVNRRAGAWPPAIKPSSLPRSSPDKLTGLFLFLGIETPPAVCCHTATRPRVGAQARYSRRSTAANQSC